MRFLTTALAMFIYWLLLSGYSKPWLIGSGIACAIIVAAFGSLMKYTDEEGHPIHLIPRGLVYWPWLVKEIVISALDVSRLIINPKLPISPTMVRVKSSQHTAVGITTYANSITLTPGTISVEVSSRDREILVHAIARDGALGLMDGDMDARVSRFERGAK